MSPSPRIFSAALLVASLGYFVDVYDLILFLAVKNPSLAAIGVEKSSFVEIGHYLLDCQMLGMLVGGLVWGILADKVGRTRALFGSIMIYSLANLANAFVNNLESYAALRFAAGFGLAGELGAGITLVAELLPKHLRGYGSTIIASIGVLGAVVAGFTGELLNWRASYILGGVLGLLLLTIRISVTDSEIFHEIQRQAITRGSILLLLRSPRRLIRYMNYIVLGLPTWFVVGILLSNATEIANTLKVIGVPKQGWCIAFCYFGLFFGDIVAGLLSQYLKSRKRPLTLFILSGLVAPLWLLTQEAPSLAMLYLSYTIVGFSAGYWVLLLTSATERFGTNIRATVTTSIPNFIRAAIIPISSVFLALKETQGLIDAAITVGIATSALATASLFFIRESFDNDLDFIEEA